MRQLIVLFVPFVSLLASPAGAGPCTAIIDDTVAEMRAGADGWWSDEVEGLVRAAAGSACVKVQSGRYAKTGGAPAPGDDAVAAAAKATAPDNRTGSDTAVVSESAQAGEERDSQQEADGDDGSWSFGGMTFRSLSGSPGTKPYQRKRKADEEG